MRPHVWNVLLSLHEKVDVYPAISSFLITREL